MRSFRLPIAMLPTPLRRARDSFDEERQEVLESVLSHLRDPALDADGRAACVDLLCHLAG
jgi:hypothetical protein